jgi:hypothetical protein
MHAVALLRSAYVLRTKSLTQANVVRSRFCLIRQNRIHGIAYRSYISCPGLRHSAPITHLYLHAFLCATWPVLSFSDIGLHETGGASVCFVRNKPRWSFLWLVVPPVSHLHICSFVGGAVAKMARTSTLLGLQLFACSIRTLTTPGSRFLFAGLRHINLALMIEAYQAIAMHQSREL